MDRFSFFNFEYKSAFIAITEVSSSESYNAWFFETIIQIYVKKQLIKQWLVHGNGVRIGVRHGFYHV
jgi:hypothetical protein